MNRNFNGRSRNLIRQFCKYRDDIPVDRNYSKYMMKRWGLEDMKESVEERFWRMWKENIFKKNVKYEEDSYKFMCSKTDYHKKK